MLLLMLKRAGSAVQDRLHRIWFKDQLLKLHKSKRCGYPFHFLCSHLECVYESLSGGSTSLSSCTWRLRSRCTTGRATCAEEETVKRALFSHSYIHTVQSFIRSCIREAAAAADAVWLSVSQLHYITTSFSSFLLLMMHPWICPSLDQRPDRSLWASILVPHNHCVPSWRPGLQLMQQNKPGSWSSSVTWASYYQKEGTY